jgi:hypothetical protein
VLEQEDHLFERGIPATLLTAIVIVLLDYQSVNHKCFVHQAMFEDFQEHFSHRQQEDEQQLHSQGLNHH